MVNYACGFNNQKRRNIEDLLPEGEGCEEASENELDEESNSNVLVEARPLRALSGRMVFRPNRFIAQNAIVFRDMYLQRPARNNNGKCGALNTCICFIDVLFYSAGQSSSLDAVFYSIGLRSLHVDQGLKRQHRSFLFI